MTRDSSGPATVRHLQTDISAIEHWLRIRFEFGSRVKYSG